MEINIEKLKVKPHDSELQDQVSLQMFGILERAHQSQDVTEFQDFIYGISKEQMFQVLNIHHALACELDMRKSIFQDSKRKGHDGTDAYLKYYSVQKEKCERVKLVKMSEYQDYGIVAHRIYNVLDVLIIWFEESFNLREYLTDNQRNELVRMIFFKHKSLTLEEIAFTLCSAKMGEYGQIKYQLDMSHFSEFMKQIKIEKSKFMAKNLIKINLVSDEAKVNPNKIRSFMHSFGQSTGGTQR